MFCIGCRFAILYKQSRHARRTQNINNIKSTAHRIMCVCVCMWFSACRVDRIIDFIACDTIMASDSTFYHCQSFVVLGVVVVEMRFTESAIRLDCRRRQSPLQITQLLIGSRAREKEKSMIWRLVAFGFEVHFSRNRFGRRCLIFDKCDW